ncbi:MAG: hypothetical protein ACOYNQ_05220 [Burkholderiales bacterium]
MLPKHTSAPPLLELIRLLNGGSPLLDNRAVHVLNTGPPRSLLVLSPDVAETLLRSPRLRQTSIWNFYAGATGLRLEDVPVLAETLTRLPLMLDGAAHRLTRQDVTRLYRRIEVKLGSWIEGFCGDFVEELRSQEHADIVKSASDFSDRLGRAMIAEELDLHWSDLPSLPDGLFVLLPVAGRMRRLEERMAAVRRTICERLAFVGRSAEEYWPLSTLMVMNRDATQAAMLHLLCRVSSGQLPANGRACLAEAAPVSLMQCRTLDHDAEIAGLDWRQADQIHISPYLLHQRAMPPRRPRPDLRCRPAHLRRHAHRASIIRGANPDYPK